MHGRRLVAGVALTLALSAVAACQANVPAPTDGPTVSTAPVLAPPTTAPPTTAPPTTTRAPLPPAPARVQVLHVIPSDVRANPALGGPTGLLATSVESWNEWLRTHTNNRTLNVARDTAGRPDIRVVRLAVPDQFIAWAGPGANPLLAQQPEMQRLINDPANRNTLFAAYYDGSNGATNVCGTSNVNVPGPSFPGHLAAIWMRAPGCYAQLPGSLGRYNQVYADIAMLHEIVHTLGGASMSCPHTIKDLTQPWWHVNDDPADLMYSSNDGKPWVTTIDANRDDYWREGAPGPANCSDVSQTRFVRPLVANATMPYGW